MNLYLSVPSTCCRTDGGHFGSFLNLSECQKGTEEFIHKDGCHAKVNGHIQTAQETTKVFDPIFSANKKSEKKKGMMGKWSIKGTEFHPL